MKWLTALVFGAVVAVALPLAFGGQKGVWMGTFASWGTVRPFAHSPGLLFSIPIFLGFAIAIRLFFGWHDR
jgi:hypothetical protein